MVNINVDLIKFRIEAIIESIKNLEMGQSCVMCDVCGICNEFDNDCSRCLKLYSEGVESSLVHPCLVKARDYCNLSYDYVNAIIVRTSLLLRCRFLNKDRLKAIQEGLYIRHIDERARIRYLLASLYYYCMLLQHLKC